MIIAFFALGTVIDSYLHDHDITIHFKILAGLLGAGLILFLAQKMKGIFLRKPVRT